MIESERLSHPRNDLWAAGRSDLDIGERLTYAIARCVCGGQIQGHRGARVRGKPTGDPFQ
jgi:hypothetical protein